MKSNHPNILFLLPDQHRFDWLGCLSGPVNTPNIDMLAGEGMTFNQAYTPSPIFPMSRTFGSNSAISSGVASLVRSAKTPFWARS